MKREGNFGGVEVYSDDDMPRTEVRVYPAGPGEPFRLTNIAMPEVDEDGDRTALAFRAADLWARLPGISYADAHKLAAQAWTPVP